MPAKSALDVEIMKWYDRVFPVFEHTYTSYF